MSSLHIAHRKIGGVADVLNRLEMKGDIVYYIEDTKIDEIDFDTFDTIFFHQPRAHLLLLTLLFFFKIERRKCIVILHESSNYSFNSSLLKSYVTTAVRFIIVNLISNFVECKSVSKYISNTFYRNFSVINYCYLYKDALDSFEISFFKKNNIAVLWVRKGDLNKHLMLLKSNLNFFSSLSYVVLGDKEEVGLLKRSLFSLGLNYQELDNKVDFNSFLNILKYSSVFISLYEREGFGLSVFFAAYYGNIVFAAKSGAVYNWLPIENYDFMNLVSNGNVTNFDCTLQSEINNDIKAISLINRNVSVGFLNEQK